MYFCQKYSYFVWILLLNILLILVILILRIGYLTLIERYILAIIQNRLGPKKPSFLGVLQVIFDGIKLIGRENIILLIIDNIYLYLLPLISLILIFFFFFILNYNFNFNNFNYELLIFLILVGFFIILLIILAYFRKSKYRFLGSIRSVNRALSFDIIFIFVILIYIWIFKEIKINKILINILFLILINFLIILAEINRIPFDFIEGERELVRGFNTEFRSLFFIFIFLSEYGIIIFYSYFLRRIIFNLNLIFTFLILFLLILTRGVFPRYRYDFLVRLIWLIILPIIIIFFFIFIFL